MSPRDEVLIEVVKKVDVVDVEVVKNVSEVTVEVVKNVSEVTVEVLKSTPEITVEVHQTTPEITVEVVKYPEPSQAGTNPGTEERVSFFEDFAQNRFGYPESLHYTGDDLAKKVLDLGGGKSVEIFYVYSGDLLVSKTLSGDVPSEVPLTKSYSYLGDTLVSKSYS